MILVVNIVEETNKVYFLKYTLHTFWGKKQNPICSSVDMAYRLAAASQDLAGVQEIDEETLNEQSYQ